jgi:hypothetical protein
VDAEHGDVPVLLAEGFAAARRRQQDGHAEQIKIETARVKIHSGQNRNSEDNKKNPMGKQYNKAEHKKRRKAYQKRKKIAVKAKIGAKKKA